MTWSKGYVLRVQEGQAISTPMRGRLEGEDRPLTQNLLISYRGAHDVLQTALAAPSPTLPLDPSAALVHPCRVQLIVDLQQRLDPRSRLPRCETEVPQLDGLLG